jgi:hypothetical protein
MLKRGKLNVMIGRVGAFVHSLILISARQFRYTPVPKSMARPFDFGCGPNGGLNFDHVRDNDRNGNGEVQPPLPVVAIQDGIGDAEIVPAIAVW